MQTKSDIAREYRNRFPDTPSHSLARKIYNENKVLFKDIDSVRFFIRYVEGKTGKKLAKSVANTKYYKEKSRPLNPFNLPESEEVSYEPLVIKGHKKIGILSDIHIPYHSIQAVTIAIDYLKKEKVDAVILNGDTLDFY